jgi:hypothetical protein
MKSFLLLTVILLSFQSFSAQASCSGPKPCKIDQTQVKEILNSPACTSIKVLLQSCTDLRISDLSSPIFTRYRITGKDRNGVLQAVLITKRVTYVIGSYGGGGWQTTYWCSMEDEMQ